MIKIIDTIKMNGHKMQCNASVFTVLLLLLVLYTNCSQTQQVKDSSKSNVGAMYTYVETSDSIVLYWKPSVDKADLLDYYEVLYRRDTDTGWLPLKSMIPIVASPRVTIYRKDVDTSSTAINFAVRVVAKNGAKSPLHNSSDTSSSPPNWRVIWPKK